MRLTMDTHIRKITIRLSRCQIAHVRVANTTKHHTPYITAKYQFVPPDPE